MIKLSKILLFLIALSCITDNVSANIRAYDIFKQGLELEQKLLIFKARDKFIDAIKIDTENKGYLTHYGWFLQHHRFYEEATIVFRKLLPLTDDKKSVYAGLAWSLKSIGRAEDSLKAYKNIVQINLPNQSWHKTFEEITQRLSDEKVQKIKILKLKISKTSDPLDLQKELFNAYSDHGELDNAIEMAEKIRLAEKLNNRIMLQFARILFWHGKKSHAEAEYKRLITSSPNSAFLYFELANILDSEGKLTEAKEALEKSLALYPHAAVTKKKLAEVTAQLGSDREAVKIAYSIVPKKSSRLIGLMARARAFHFSGQLESAQTAYQKVLDEYPSNRDALWGMTETSIYTGRYKNAHMAIEKWERTAPDQTLPEQKKRLALFTAPTVKLQTEYYNNSANFTRKNYGAEFGFYTKTYIYLNAGYMSSKFSQNEFKDVSRDSIFMQAEKQISERLQAAGRFAINKYDNQNTNFNGRLSILFKQSKKLTSKFSYRHFDIVDTVLPFNNTIYSYVVTIGSVGLDIQSNDYQFYLLYNPLQKLSLSGEFIHGDYSTGNQRRSLVLEAGYQMLDKPYLRAIYNYFYLDFKDPAELFTEGSKTESAYWDPIDFDTHTLRLEFKRNHNIQISYGADVGLSYIPKSGGVAKAAFLFASYRFMEKLSLRLDARWFNQDKGINRFGKGGGFRANNYNMTFQYRF